MKLSLNWIFDHIGSSWKDHSISELFARFNTTTAEIDAYEYIKHDLNLFTVVEVQEIKEKNIEAFSKELNISLTLPFRSDAQKGDLFIAKKSNEWGWALLADLGSSKEGLLTKVFIPADQQSGQWKNNFEAEDYILTIGNTSITHRPDLWGHRGVAREMAAILNVPFLSEEHFLAKLNEKSAPVSAYAGDIECSIETNLCKRLSALSLTQVAFQPSILTMAHRLLKVDSKPINALVDGTNYVMQDFGQPMHAFDHAAFNTTNKLCVTTAPGKPLTLLDGQSIELSKEALVISDCKQPLALTGIIGGASSSVSSNTQSLLIEAGNFDAMSIRTTAAHYKIRTEASTRFEKTLDPEQTSKALKRYIQLLGNQSINFQVNGDLVTVGECQPLPVIMVSHHNIEKKLGVKIQSNFVLQTLSKLEIDVVLKDSTAILYEVKVPSFRAKDLHIEEDIIEEIGRFFGYDAIPQELPQLVMQPTDKSLMQKKYSIKQLLAYHTGSHEVANYALYDEEFLKSLSWDPGATLILKNPVSENMKKLVTSLIPNILKVINTNKVVQDELRFFEWNKIWPFKKGQFIEQTSLSGIFYHNKKAVDFYTQKDELEALFEMLYIQVIWKKAEPEALQPWYHPYKTAALFHNQTFIGYAGCSNPAFFKSFWIGDAFIYELDADYLMKFVPETTIFKPLSRFQDISRDISMLTPLAITVQELKDTILKVSPAIVKVELLDFFQKPEWDKQRSVTMRFYVRDYEKTLVTQEIDQLYERIVQHIKPMGIEIR